MKTYYYYFNEDYDDYTFIHKETYDSLGVIDEDLDRELRDRLEDNGFVEATETSYFYWGDSPDIHQVLKECECLKLIQVKMKDIWEE